MTIKPGRSYRMRNGTKSGIVEPTHGNIYIWKAGTRTYAADGRESVNMDGQYDLMELWEPGAAEKLICDVTLEDYRRGVHNLRPGEWGA